MAWVSGNGIAFRAIINWCQYDFTLNPLQVCGLGEFFGDSSAWALVASACGIVRGRSLGHDIASSSLVEGPRLRPTGNSAGMGCNPYVDTSPERLRADLRQYLGNPQRSDNCRRIDRRSPRGVAPRSGFPLAADIRSIMVHHRFRRKLACSIADATLGRTRRIATQDIAEDIASDVIS